MRAAGQQHIGGQHAGTAGIGHDGQVRTFGPGLFGQHFSHIEQFLNCLHAQHANAAEGGVKHFVTAGERARMGGGRLGRGLRAADFEDDDRFGQGDLARGG